MLATFGRVLARTTGLNATTKTLPVYKTVISLNQFLPTTTRALATATAPKKAGTTTTKKTTATTASRAKAPTKKTTITTSTTKKAPAKTAATKKASATATSRKTIEAPKREKKKPLSDDEKLKLQVKTLLEKALDPPNIHANASTWVEFLKTKFAAAKGNGVPGNILLTSNSAQWVSEYKALSPAQVETLKAKAEASKESSRAKLVKWVRSHTPAEIHEANLARIQIRKLQSNHDPAPRGIRSSSFPAIPDDRYPRGPRTANIFYALDKLAGVPVEQRMSVVPEAMKGFATLPVAEQNKYKELAAKDLIRYHNELRTVGIQPSA